MPTNEECTPQDLGVGGTTPTRRERRVRVTHSRTGPQSWSCHSADLPGLTGGGRSLRGSVYAAEAAIRLTVAPTPDEMVIVEHHGAESAEWPGIVLRARIACDEAREAEYRWRVACAAAVAELKESDMTLRDLADLTGLSHQTVAEWIKRAEAAHVSIDRPSPELTSQPDSPGWFLSRIVR